MRKTRAKAGHILLPVVVIVLIATVLLPQPFLHYARASPVILRVPSQFATIQAAINAANPGDTVQVSGGTYHENVAITKSLNLVGASPSNTTIDASGFGAGINITKASAVYVSGFTIRNTDIYNSGILVYYSTNVTISGNFVQASKQTNGAYIVSSNSSTVKDNVFTGNLYGINVQGGFGNLIQGNNATGNPSGDIFVSQSSGNKIADNILRASLTGLMLWNGAVGNIVSRNLIANNTSEGISILNSPSAGNLFVENRIEFNRAPPDTAGVSIQNSTLNRFYHNTIANNLIQIFGSYNPDITSNMWDNETGLTLKTDHRIMFVDSNGNNVWDFNETVVYDVDSNGMFDVGDIRIASANGIVPAAGTKLTVDSKIRFVDLNNDNTWERGEPVVYDVNSNNVFDSGEPAIAGVGGNFWSNYNGLDNGSHGFTGDGIGDTLIPTPCPNGGNPCSFAGPKGVDWYPLMSPWRPSNLNVTVSARPLGGYAALLVSFAGTATGGLRPYSYSWNFGDGTVAQQQNVTHTYSSKGSYIATLTVTDASPATGLNEVSVTVLSPTGNLALRVLDQNMKPIQGANVTLLLTPFGQQGLSRLANNLGNATFVELTPGSYTVQASSPGYQAAKKNVIVVLGETTNEQLVLSPAPSNSFPTALVGGGLAAAISALVLLLLFLKRRKKRLDRIFVQGKAAQRL